METGEAIYFVLGCLHLVVLVVYTRQLFDVSLLLVSWALVYDNFCIAHGRVLHPIVGPETFLLLSKPRFLMHLAFTPLLAQSGYGNTLLTLALIGLGFGIDWSQPREYFVAEYWGTVRYSVRPPAPPIPAILTTLVVFGHGIKVGEWNLVCGSGAMLVLAGIPPSKVGLLPGQFGEVLIMWGMWRAAYESSI
jgi:hypothetical protein